MRTTRPLAVAIALVLAGASGALLAQTYQPPQDVVAQAPVPEAAPLFDFALGLGAQHTDNLTRSDSNEISQNILQPTFNFLVNHQGTTLQAQVVGVAQYNDYIEGYFGNEFRGQLTGLLNWTLSPQRLNYVLQDYSSVEPVSTRAGNSPSNLQQVNVFVTGPTLTFQLGGSSTWRGEADLRYINTTASKTHDFDSQRGVGALRILHNLNATDTASLNAEEQHVAFDNVDPLTGIERYDEQSVFGRYESHLARVDIDLSLGASQVSFPRGRPGHSGPLARGSIGWHLDARNTIQITGTNQLADSSTNLVQPPNLAANQLTDPTLAVGRTVISSAVFRQRNLSVGYAYAGPRLGITLSPYYTQLRELDASGLSRNGYGVVAGASWLFNPLTTLTLSAGNQTTEYLSDHSRDRDRTIAATLSRQLTPNWSWSVIASQDNRHSTRPGFGYTENEILAFVYYRR